MEVAVEELDEFEIILVNDGSTDRTGAIMEDWAGRYENISVYHNEKNGDPGVVFRRGFAEARPSYVTWWAADDHCTGESVTQFLRNVGAADIFHIFPTTKPAR